MIEAHIVETKTHGRYLIRRGSGHCLVGFHGYGETAEKNFADLEKLGLDWTLVAVQGLHRFYSRSNDIAASWMTREDRDYAKADNIEYVQRVIDAVKPYDTLAFLGFSQGGVMAYRAANAIPCSGLIILGHDFPPDVEPVSVPVLLARGENDLFYTQEKLKEDLNSLPQAETCVFEGGHEWTDEFRRAASEFLRRLK